MWDALLRVVLKSFVALESYFVVDVVVIMGFEWYHACAWYFFSSLVYMCDNRFDRFSGVWVFRDILVHSCIHKNCTTYSSTTCTSWVCTLQCIYSLLPTDFDTTLKFHVYECWMKCSYFATSKFRTVDHYLFWNYSDRGGKWVTCYPDLLFGFAWQVKFSICWKSRMLAFSLDFPSVYAASVPSIDFKRVLIYFVHV